MARPPQPEGARSYVVWGDFRRLLRIRCLRCKNISIMGLARLALRQLTEYRGPSSPPSPRRAPGSSTRKSVCDLLRHPINSAITSREARRPRRRRSRSCPWRSHDEMRTASRECEFQRVDHPRREVAAPAVDQLPGTSCVRADPSRSVPWLSDVRSPPRVPPSGARRRGPGPTNR